MIMQKNSDLILTKEKSMKDNKTIELLEEWKEALQNYKENREDWNNYFYLLQIKKELKRYGIDTEEI